MAINRLQQWYVPELLVTLTLNIFKTKRYRLILLLSGTIYAVIYMFTVGIISYIPGFSSATTTLPVIHFTSYGISIIPADNFFIFIFYSALVFLIISSFLVGLNTSLMFYSRKLSKACRTKNNNIGSRGIFGILPAFFTSFSCCGGGFLAFAIGPTAFSSLALYSNYIAPLAIAVLTIGTILMLTKISKLCILSDVIFREVVVGTRA